MAARWPVPGPRDDRATLVLDGDTLRVETNSEPRMDRVLATLTRLDPAMTSPTTACCGSGATLVLDGDTLRVETNSEPRMDRVLATLTRLDPGPTAPSSWR